ncbi:hypothetical protein JIN85_20550, partial [Luteolibacter pohnpeiensis]|nr:hypothetical protein [Luteolibacter pohnpeiensis]
QSQRWGFSPFAVAGHASVVHGRLCWEGKLVAAVIEAKLGVRLDYAYSGSGKGRKVVVSGTLTGERNPRTVEGTVQQWETTGNGSPWRNSADWDRQLAYRGSREWARRHAPGVMLGVVTDDENLEMRNVTPPAETLSGVDALKASTQPRQSAKEDAPAPEPPPKQPEPEPEAKPALDLASPRRAYLLSVETKSGVTKTGKAWTLYIISMELEDVGPITANTFSKSLADEARDLIEQSSLVTLEQTPKGYELKSIAPNVEQEEGGLL